jgi:hypothetical protein
MDNQWGIINEYTSVSHNMMDYSKYHISAVGILKVSIGDPEKYMCLRLPWALQILDALLVQGSLCFLVPLPGCLAEPLNRLGFLTFDFCLSTSIPVLTTSTCVVAWPQGDQFLGGGM